MRLWADCGAFFRAFRRNFHTTGAILPSSRFLARAMTSDLKGPRRPARILEVGPGTGAVTREIVRLLQDGDRLDAVEINSSFVEHLRKRFEQEALFRNRLDQIELIEGAVEELIGTAVYDFIISGLPLNNFAVSQVRTIFRTFNRLLKPGGTLSYYEYAFVRQLKTPFVGREERRRLLKIGRVVTRYIRNYQIGRKRILINVPPATVRRLRFKPALAASQAATQVPIPEPAP
ncbi:MAG: methyltransferase domain-containing protein [Planctomycetes bacterium]|nr:methyltransferase domain-containing protein [Planctomycetota bacterium]